MCRAIPCSIKLVLFPPARVVQKGIQIWSTVVNTIFDGLSACCALAWAQIYHFQLRVSYHIQTVSLAEDEYGIAFDMEDSCRLIAMFFFIL